MWRRHDVVVLEVTEKKKKRIKARSLKREGARGGETREASQLCGPIHRPTITCWRLQRPKFDYVSDVHIWPSVKIKLSLRQTKQWL